jgi:peptidoglycan lytic transglycosylase
MPVPGTPRSDRGPHPGRPGRRRRAAFLFLPLLLLLAFSGKPARGERGTAPLVSPRFTQTGVASWYGPGFHGRPTASTALYNQFAMTAAHPTLPLGSRVIVTNLENRRSVEVIITDRGPFAGGRVLDLSFAAGKLLGIIEPGTALVRLEVADGGPAGIPLLAGTPGYTLQVGVFARPENAERLRRELSACQPGVCIVPIRVGNARYYRVQVGTYPDRDSAVEPALRLSRAGFRPFVLRN